MATETITITADVPDGMEFDRLDGDRILYRKKRWRAEPDGLYWTIYCGGLCLFADIRTRTEDQCWESGLYWQTQAEGEAWLSRAHAANRPAVAEEWPKHGDTIWVSRGADGAILFRPLDSIFIAHLTCDRERLASGNIHRTEAEANAKIAEMEAVREASETTADPSPSCTPSRAEAVASAELNDAERALVERKQVIAAIKSLRARTGMSLWDAKRMTDAYAATIKDAPAPKSEWPKPGDRVWTIAKFGACPPHQVTWPTSWAFDPATDFPSRELARAAWKVHPANTKRKGGAK